MWSSSQGVERVRTKPSQEISILKSYFFLHKVSVTWNLLRVYLKCKDKWLDGVAHRNMFCLAEKNFIVLILNCCSTEVLSTSLAPGDEEKVKTNDSKCLSWQLELYLEEVI